jgi:hypothetical protein
MSVWLLADVAGCWRLGRLYIDPGLNGLPPGIVRAAQDLATTRPVALLTEGRLFVNNEPRPWPLRPRLAGRCSTPVTLHTQTARVGLGTTIELADGGDARVAWHEVAHALGQWTEAGADRLGGLLHRAAARAA